MSDIQNLIIDHGSAVCKVGFSGDENPKSVFSTIIGRPIEQADDSDEFYVGNQAQSRRDALNLSYPIEQGSVKNWDDMEKIWSYIFENALNVSPEEHAILLTETPQNPKANKQRITEVMFETFNVPSLYILNQAVLSAYAAGKKHCIVLDSGDGTTHAVPVYEGLPISHAITNFPVTGRSLTTYLMELLHKRSHILNCNIREIVREIKEKFCYVAVDCEEEVAENISYKLPDGKVIEIGNEIHLCPESLFRSSYLGYDDNGVHNTIFESIMHCSMDIRKNMYSNIVLSGGTTKLRGFGGRLYQEMNKLVPDSINPTICLQRHEFSTWVGGSVFASMTTFENMCVTKEEYDEFGYSIIHDK